MEAPDRKTPDYEHIEISRVLITVAASSAGVLIRHIAFLPSDFALAMRQPPEAPTKATRKLDPQQPTTEIPELRVMPLTPLAYQ